MQTADHLQNSSFDLFGIEGLDELVKLNSGLVLLKSQHQSLLFYLVSRIIANSVKNNKKVLYLHFVDYHNRYWSINIDNVLGIVQHLKIDLNKFLEMVKVVRAFTTDQIEENENWKMIASSVTNRVKVFIVDSLTELYLDNRDVRKLLYVVGKLKKLCMRNNMLGIILDYLPTYLTYYIANSSTAILEFSSFQGRVHAILRKHPSIKEQVKVFTVDSGFQSFRKAGIWRYVK